MTWMSPSTWNYRKRKRNRNRRQREAGETLPSLDRARTGVRSCRVREVSSWLMFEAVVNSELLNSRVGPRYEWLGCTSSVS
jgi:hypothetical protein